MTRTQTHPRSFRIDPRLIIGIFLVAASVLGMVSIVTAADSTVEVYAARAALSPGTQLAIDDLTVRKVQLANSDDHYLAVDTTAVEGLLVIQPVAAGELVPRSALGDPAGLRVASVVLPVRAELAQSIDAGSLVDVWAAAKVEGSVFGPPVVLVSQATVVRIVESRGVISAASIGTIEVLVPRGRIARVLDAIANNDAISLVPSALPVRD